jgi:hypothetical protein
MTHDTAQVMAGRAAREHASDGRSATYAPHLELALPLGIFKDIFDADHIFVPAEMPQEPELAEQQLSLRTRQNPQRLGLI